VVRAAGGDVESDLPRVVLHARPEVSDAQTDQFEARKRSHRGQVFAAAIVAVKPTDFYRLSSEAAGREPIWGLQWSGLREG
jgi:hypothetical protein